METSKSVDAKRPSAEMVQTLRADGRPGEAIPKDEYETWSYFILSTLAKEEELTLNDLLERAAKSNPNITKAVESKISWYVLQVKRDLEARSLISSIPVPSRKHTFFLQLTRQGYSKINYQFQVQEWSNNDL